MAPGVKCRLWFSPKENGHAEGGSEAGCGNWEGAWALVSVQVSNFTCLGFVSTRPRSLQSLLCDICLLEGLALFPGNLSELGASESKKEMVGGPVSDGASKGAMV